MGITITRHFFPLPAERLDAARVLGLRRMDQLGDLGIVHVLGRDQRLAGRDLGLDGLFLEILDHRRDAGRSHAQRVLDDQALDLALAHGVDQGLAGVEADEDHALPGRGGRRRLGAGGSALVTGARAAEKATRNDQNRPAAPARPGHE